MVENPEPMKFKQWLGVTGTTQRIILLLMKRTKKTFHLKVHNRKKYSITSILQTMRET